MKLPQVSLRYDRKADNFFLDYRNPEGRRRRLRIGSNQDEAERKRIWALNLLMSGKDPEREMERTQQIEEQRSITLREFFPIFLERHGKNQGRSQQRNYRIFMANLERCPQISKVPIGEIRKPLLLDCVPGQTRMGYPHPLQTTRQSLSETCSTVRWSGRFWTGIHSRELGFSKSLVNVMWILPSINYRHLLTN